MAATYSTDLRIELIGQGEQAGTWGITTNTNLGTIIEQAIAGVTTVNIANLTSYTLLALNGASDQARNAVIIFTGALTANCNVIAPSVNKLYVLNNQTTGGYAVNIKTSTGNVYAISSNTTAFVYCDALNFYDGVNSVNSNLLVNANANVSGTVTLRGDVYGNVNTGQWYLPYGNTAVRTSTPTEGLIRYNSEGKFYEGYTNANWVRFIVANEGSYTINYVIVGGGGGGGGGQGGGGGGGAGQFVASSTTGLVGTVLTVYIGAGGASGQTGGDGGSTYIPGLVSTNGGTGGGLSPNQNDGGAGGASGQPYSGGAGHPDAVTGGRGGGGGGSAAAGTAATPYVTGVGGAGTNSVITGSSAYYGGGGGGAGQSSGAGGIGGGGYGATPYIPGSAGGLNTGGGGGGGTNAVGGNGGTGVVILSMPTVNYTGVFTGSPTVTTTGSNTVLTYTGSGTYTE